MAWKFEIPGSVKTVNPYPVDGHRWNNNSTPYLSSNEVLSENVLGIRMLGQTYAVDDGVGGIEEWWFEKGTSDADLVLKATSGGASLIQVTYSELKALRDAGTLSQGAKYVLTDYNTVYKQKVSNVVSDSAQGVTDGLNTFDEPLIVTATETDKLAAQAFSTIYPKDVIFYDIDKDLTDGGSVNTKGAIVRRIDTELNIDVAFDWKAIKFRRWNTSAVDYNGATTYARMQVIKDGTKYYISAVDGNLGNLTTDKNFWVEYIDTAVVYSNYLAAKSSGVVYGLNIESGEYIDCFLLCDLQDLTDYYGGVGVTEIQDVFVSYSNTVFMFDSSFGWQALNSTRIELYYGGDITFRPAWNVTNLHVNSGTYSQLNNIFLYGDIIDVLLTDMDKAENTFILGLWGVAVKNIENSIIIGDLGMSAGNGTHQLSLFYSIAWIESSLIASNSHVSGYMNTLTIKTSSVYNNSYLFSRFDTDVTGTIINNGDVYTWSPAIRLINCVITGTIDGCAIPALKDCIIDGEIIGVISTAIWNEVTIPANVSLNHVTFTTPQWYGKNTWSGTALTLYGVIVSRLYTNRNITTGTAPTLEKLWYEEVDINGGITYKLLE